MPKAVRDAIGMFPMEVDGEEIILNIAPQIAKTFILEDSPSFRMKILNKLTGNDLLDMTAQSFNKDILRIGREAKVLEVEVEEKNIECRNTEDDLALHKAILDSAVAKAEVLKARIKKLLKVNELYQVLLVCVDKRIDIKSSLEKIKIPDEKSVNLLDERIQKFNLVERIVSKLNQIKKDRVYYAEQLAKISYPKDIDALELRIERFEKTKKLVDKLSQIKDERTSIKNLLSGIIYPDVRNLPERITRFEKVKGLVDNLRQKESTGKTLVSQITDITGEINAKRDEYKEILKKYGRCPTCNSEITRDVLEGINL
jgi:hypothetical protein